MAGFKVADVFAEVSIKDETAQDIAGIDARLKSIEDKIVPVKADDQATPVIAKVEDDKIEDKIIPVKADDQATPVVNKVEAEEVDDKVVPIKAEDKTSGPLAAIGGKLESWAGGIGLGVGGILAAGLATGLTQANIVTGFENQMGATPAVAAHYGKVAADVFGQGFASSREPVSEALNLLSSDMKNFGNIGEDAQTRIAGKAVKVSENFGDMNLVMQAASNLVSNQLTDSFDGAFDLITVGMQNAGSKGEDLLETLREYPGFFHQLGFSGSQSIDLLKRGLDAGAENTDRFADAIKEFSIRAVEAGGTAAPVFQALGFDAQDMARTFAAGGEQARVAFLQVFEALQKVEDPAKRAQYAVGLFGTQSEDTMTRLLPKLDLTGLGMDNVAGAADRLKSTLTPMEQLTNSFSEAMGNLVPIVLPVIKVVSDIAGVLGKVAKGLDDVLGMAPKKNGLPIIEVFNRLKDAMGGDFGTRAERTNNAIHDLIMSIDGGAETAQRFGISYDDMLNALAGSTAGLDKWNAALKAANDAGGEDADTMNALNGMLGTIQRESKHAADAVSKEEQAQRGSTQSKKDNASASRDAANATQQQTDAVYKLTDAVLGQINKDIGYRQSVIATKDAEKELTDAVTKKGAKSQEATEAGLNLESAQVRQAQAARDLALANSKAADDTGKNADATRAYTSEVLSMAMAAGTNASPALRSMIGGLTQTDLAAAGATKSIDGAGNAVIKLPNGKEIIVEAKDLASKPIEDIANKKYTATVWLYLKEAPAGSSPLSQGRLAEGGPVIGGSGTKDDVPILAMGGEYMIKAKVVRKPGVRQLLELLNNEKLPGFAEGGEIPGGLGMGQPYAPMGDTVHITNNFTLAPDTDIDRLAARVSRHQELARRNRR